jgi:hypothetical protein
MKALVAAFAAVSLSVLCAGQVSARGMRGSGQSGRVGLSHSSGRPAHPSGLPAHFGRSGVHLESGGHPSTAIASATTGISSTSAFFCATIILVTMGFSPSTHLVFVAASSGNT